MKVISLFSGCDGLDLSFEKARFEIPIANEFDSTIWATFEKNHPNTKLVRGDIRNIKEADFPDEVDGIIGGRTTKGKSVMKKIRDFRQIFWLAGSPFLCV